jgi:hypothetical protein
VPQLSPVDEGTCARCVAAGRDIIPRHRRIPHHGMGRSGQQRQAACCGERLLVIGGFRINRYT